MAVVYSTTVKNARMTAVRDQIDAGGAAGVLEIGTSNMGTVLATITLGYSGASTGTVSNGILTLAGFPRSDTSADAGGVAAAARIRTSAAADVITGLTVGTSNADIIVDNTSINVGQLVTINSAVITHAA